uniref:Retrotransposon gag domain-containing protein n=1 Tax=Tanacetum cinerariifolium TaxID=118510 RepID=A0A6L2L810_TANCI|nr:hypothetical protein [Tanacetum cinerariifolium]
MKQNELSDDALRLSLFPYSLTHHATAWYDRHLRNSIHTFDDMMSKFLSKYFSPSMVTKLRNEIMDFRQKLNESLFEAWELCMRTRSSSNLPVESFPNLSFSNLKRRNRRRSKQPFILEESPIDMMADQRTMAELLRAPTEGYAETIMVPPILVEQFELKHNLINMMTLNQFFGLENDNPHDHIRCDANSSSSSEIAKLTHAVNQQTSAVTTAMTAILKKFQATPPSASVKVVEEICVTCGGVHPNEMKNSIQASMSNQTNELKNMMASFFQMNTASTSGLGPLPSNTIANPKGKLNAIITQSGIVLDGSSVLMPPPFINPEEDERVEETLTDQDLAEYTIKVPPPLLGLPELISTRMTLELANRAICTSVGIARDVFVLVGKFTFPADFVISYYESDPRVPLILGRPFLRTAHALIDVHGEEMILCDGDERLTLNMRHDTSSYSNQPQKESINMINMYNNSCEDFLENLFEINHLSSNPTFSSHSDLTSPKVTDDILDQKGGNVLIEKVINLDSTKKLPPPHNVNPSSGSTTSSSLNHLLEEFADELTLITFPLGNDDLPFDIEYDIKEIEYLLNHDASKEMDSILEDLIDESNLVDLNNNLVDTMPEMFTDEHALDYSSPPLYDEYDDDLFEVESDTEYVYDDPFDSKGKKIKESKLLIDELDLHRSSDFLPSPEYESFLFEDFSKVDALPSTNNKDKVFNLSILIQENIFKVITHVAPDKNVKKIAISHASLIVEDFDPPLYELPFLKEITRNSWILKTRARGFVI